MIITLDRSPSSRFSLCSSPPLDSHQPTLNQFRSEYDKKKQCEEKRTKLKITITSRWMITKTTSWLSSPGPVYNPARQPTFGNPCERGFATKQRNQLILCRQQRQNNGINGFVVDNNDNNGINRFVVNQLTNFNSKLESIHNSMFNPTPPSVGEIIRWDSVNSTFFIRSSARTLFEPSFVNWFVDFTSNSESIDETNI